MSIKNINRKMVFIILFGLLLPFQTVFAQIVHDGGYGGRGNRQRDSNEVRHYYHDGVWNRNGWYGWGIPGPVYSDGVLVASLPPGAVPVNVEGNTYFYGNNMYFRPKSAGGFSVVTLPSN